MWSAESREDISVMEELMEEEILNYEDEKVLTEIPKNKKGLLYIVEEKIVA